MKKNLLLLVTIIVGTIVLLSIPRTTESYKNTNIPCTPTFEDGDGPYYVPNSPNRSILNSPSSRAVSLTVSGRLLKSDCKTPVTRAVIDLWQANENGIYVNEWNRGKIVTNNKGEYQFSTIVPKGYGEGTAYRPPHIHFKIWVDNQLLITSEMFFPDVHGKEGFHDAYIMDLLKQSSFFGRGHWIGHHDIILP
jgi:protocatechuate 3,4-dioxygenase beta subunit